jgi:hypothetical protein
MSKKSPETPCGAPPPGNRTLLTFFLREERDRSETKIRTVPRRLADEGLRWPGDEVIGIGGADGIDRERHQYRSAAWRDSGPVNVE